MFDSKIHSVGRARRNSWWPGVACAILLGAVSHPTRAQTVEYDVTVLGQVPGAYLTYSRGLNDRGEAVGMAMFSPGGLKAWIWSESQGFTLLPQPAEITNYGAVDITNSGVIAGDGGGDAGEIWRYTSGTYEMLGFLPGTPIPRAVGISATGSITGTCFGTLFYNPRHSFLAAPGSPMVSALDNSEAWGINDFDQITGTSGNTAYRITPGVGVELLPALGSRVFTRGRAINNLGNVVGIAFSTTEHSDVPFLFSDADGMQEIGDFGGRALARDVNDRNEVTGEWEPASTRMPWVWSEGQGVRFLNDVIDPGLNLRLHNTQRINNAGQILCSARDQNSTLVQLLLTPVDQPAAWLNFGSGWPGTQGVPAFTSRSNPVLGSTLTLDIENSLGAPTQGWLFLGTSPASLATPWGGTLLVTPSFLVSLGIPATGSTPGGLLPADPTLDGLSLYLQVLEADPGASDGFSFTPGLELRLGTH